MIEEKDNKNIGGVYELCLPLMNVYDETRWLSCRNVHDFIPCFSQAERQFCTVFLKSLSTENDCSSKNIKTHFALWYKQRQKLTSMLSSVSY